MNYFNCNPIGYSRADFLLKNGNVKKEFGHTTIHAKKSMLTPSDVQFTKVKRGYVLKNFQVSLPKIDSIYTQAGTFIEGHISFFGK